MNYYTEETLKALETETRFFVPKHLQKGPLRLETKLAYVAILDVLKEEPLFNEGKAYIKKNNPKVIESLKVLANKKVDEEKMNKYYDELADIDYIEINDDDLYVMVIE